MIAISLFQPFAHYRNPTTWNHPRTYPLPPRSSVIGMLQNLTRDYYNPDWKNVKVAITANFTALFQHYSWFYKGEGFWMDDNGLWIKINNWINYKQEKSISPQFVEEIFGNYITIFVEGFEEKILKALENPPSLYLGRAEDIVFIRSYKQITLEPVSYDIAKFYYWEKDNNGLLVPLHSDFMINNRPVKNRAELFANREKEEVTRYVYWDRLSIKEPGTTPSGKILGGVLFNDIYYIITDKMLLRVNI